VDPRLDEARQEPFSTTKTERLESEGVDAVAGIARASAILRDGGTVAFPTETVYGLGANAFNPAAIAKIFAAKQRPAWDPLIVHVDSTEMLEHIAVYSGFLARHVETLTAAFWPGPLTLLLPPTLLVPESVTAGRPLVGVRMPAHPIARQLIHRAGLPIAAPSANLFGRPSPTTAAHVLADLDGRIDAVLDGGATTLGLESTVFDVGAMLIYRPGAVTAAMLARTLRQEVQIYTPDPATPTSPLAPESLPSPGVGIRHYAPRARLILVAGRQELLREVKSRPDIPVGVMLPDEWDAGGASAVFRWGPWDNAEILARLFFFGLRLLDDRRVQVIVCPVPTMDGLGEALRDRLTKAARPE
jgi:L-threonylcarbamoyladenylate synthase